RQAPELPLLDTVRARHPQRGTRGLRAGRRLPVAHARLLGPLRQRCGRLGAARLPLLRQGRAPSAHARGPRRGARPFPRRPDRSPAVILRGPDELLSPLREALRDTPADEADIHLHRRRAAITRYSHSSIHQNALTEDAVANTRGVALYARGSLAYLRALVQSDVGSGYAEDLTWRAGELDPAGVAARAVEKCALDRDRSELAPGDYEAVFEELAVAEILRIVSLTGLGGQSVKEGRSFMAGRIGEKVTGEAFTLVEDALDPRTLAIPFDVEGTPKRRVTLVERGVAKGPVYDRTSAKAMGTRSTGHAADPSRYATGGHAANLTMAGGAASRDELVR